MCNNLTEDVLWLHIQGSPQESLRCGPVPPDSAALGGTASRSLVAWGQLYTDRGDNVRLLSSPQFSMCLELCETFS